MFYHESRKEANAAIFTCNREFASGGLNNKLVPIFDALEFLRKSNTFFN